MPQIKIVPCNKETRKVLMGDRARYLAFELKLRLAVEDGFRIPTKYREDIAVTVTAPAERIYSEANVQMEVGYTAGEDEYKQGKPFDPTIEEQTKVADLIYKEFATFLRDYKLPHLSLSVWCQPFHKSVYKQYY